MTNRLADGIKLYRTSSVVYFRLRVDGVPYRVGLQRSRDTYSFSLFDNKMKALSNYHILADWLKKTTGCVDRVTVEDKMDKLIPFLLDMFGIIKRIRIENL